jgi:hypothetical protein
MVTSALAGVPLAKSIPKTPLLLLSQTSVLEQLMHCTNITKKWDNKYLICTLHFALMQKGMRNRSMRKKIKAKQLLRSFALPTPPPVKR